MFKKINFVYCFALIMTVYSCELVENVIDKGDDADLSTEVKTLEAGKWRISLYNDSGKDETNNYIGYSFSFKDNVVSSTKGSTTTTGTYSNGSDDDSKNLILFLGTTSPLDELNDDWHIIESTDTKVRLIDESGGGSGTDLLTFEKI